MPDQRKWIQFLPEIGKNNEFRLWTSTILTSNHFCSHMLFIPEQNCTIDSSDNGFHQRNKNLKSGKFE